MLLYLIFGFEFIMGVATGVAFTRFFDMVLNDKEDKP